jgi:hypothetical protein
MSHPTPPATPWQRLQHPLVRDLAWCCFSQPLVTTDQAIASASADITALNASDWTFLQQLEQDPTPLQQWMDKCPSPRLGFLFERYWQFWWLNGPKSDHRAYLFNRQIQKNGRTLGEIDCLELDTSLRKLVHTELAVKFYLGIDSQLLPARISASSDSSWVGPNIRDRLDLKLSQMRNHQLRLLDDKEHQQVIPEKWSWQSLESRLLVRGRLFYPCAENFGDTPLRAPAEAATKHQRGYWLHRQYWNRLPQQVWLPLLRRQWFAPLQFEKSWCPEGFLNKDLPKHLQHHFGHYRQPIQLAGLHLTDHGWIENHRVFIVPDGWPGNT